MASELRIFLKRVEDSMSYLMGFQGDQLIGAAFKAYPDPSNEIHEKLGRGESPLRAASEMLRIMLVAEIEKLPADQRELLAAYLVSTGEAPPSTFAKVCRMYCDKIYIARDDKRLDEQWCLDCVDDVFAAATGFSSEDGSNDSVRRALEKAPQPPPSRDAEQHRTELDAGTDRVRPPESQSDSLEVHKSQNDCIKAKLAHDG